MPDGSVLASRQLSDRQRKSLHRAANSPGPRRGRPALSDDLLIEVVRAYIDESSQGRGAIGRVAKVFDRPEPTVRDWISAARKRGYLAPAVPGRRGAEPGPNLPRKPTLADTKPDLSRERKRTVLRLIEAAQILDANLSESAVLLYVVSCLVCNEIGAAKMDNVTAAMQDPLVVETAIDLLDRARRRHFANSPNSAARSSNDASGGPQPPNPLFTS